MIQTLEAKFTLFLLNLVLFAETPAVTDLPTDYTWYHDGTAVFFDKRKKRLLGFCEGR